MTIISLHVTERATVTVRRFGRVLPTAWASVSDDGDRWELTGSFLDLFAFAEQLTAAVLEQMPEHHREKLDPIYDRPCGDPMCPCHEVSA